MVKDGRLVRPAESMAILALRGPGNKFKPYRLLKEKELRDIPKNVMRPANPDLPPSSTAVPASTALARQLAPPAAVGWTGSLSHRLYNYNYFLILF